MGRRQPKLTDPRLSPRLRPSGWRSSPGWCNRSDHRPPIRRAL